MDKFKKMNGEALKIINYVQTILDELLKVIIQDLVNNELFPRPMKIRPKLSMTTLDPELKEEYEALEAIGIL